MLLSRALKQFTLATVITMFSTSVVFAADLGQATASDVNVRAEANTEAKVLGKIDQGDTYTVMGKEGKWFEISFEGETAFVYDDYFTLATGEGAPTENVEKAGNEIESTYGMVTADSGLKLRKEASMNSIILTVLPKGTEVEVDRVGSQWIRVITDGGQKGYVSAEFLSVRKGERTSRSNPSSKGEEVVAYGKQFIGTPYVWGGTNLSKGVDCSGFVYAVFKNFGISLNRSSASMASNGVAIEKSELVAGDLVFFNTGGNSPISHVGIYMGDGNYIHCTDGAAYGVTVTDLNSGYSAQNYHSARRVLR